MNKKRYWALLVTAMLLSLHLAGPGAVVESVLGMYTILVLVGLLLLEVVWPKLRFIFKGK